MFVFLTLNRSIAFWVKQHAPPILTQILLIKTVSFLILQMVTFFCSCSVHTRSIRITSSIEVQRSDWVPSRIIPFTLGCRVTVGIKNLTFCFPFTATR